MPTFISNTPSLLKEITLYIKILWISLLYYIFYIIARLLPDSPEFKAILDSIDEENPQDPHLDLSSQFKSNSSPIPIIQLCLWLDKNPAITSVDFKWNGLGDISAMAFAKTKGLKALNLNRSFHISNVGAVALANNTVLESLDISYNSIENQGIMALAKNEHLIHLDIHSNRVNGDFSAHVFSNNTSLKTLCLGSHIFGGRHDYNISDEGAIALAANATLKSLQFKGVNIGVAGYKALAQNKTLRSIDGIDYYSNPKNQNEILQAFYNSKTLIHCSAWLALDWIGKQHIREEMKARNQENLRSQLFLLMIVKTNINLLPDHLILHVGSFYISDINTLTDIVNASKSMGKRTNSIPSEAGMFSAVHHKSTSTQSSEDETVSEHHPTGLTKFKLR